MKDNSKIDINELIFQYKWWIGSFLLVAVLASGGYLFWRENGLKQETRMTNDEQISQLEKRIQDSESKIQQFEDDADSAAAVTVPVATTSVDSGAVAGASTNSSSKTSTPTGKVNLNTGTIAELDTLPGIGAAYAQRIIDYRTTSGGFKDVSELKNIKGIGDKTYEKLKDLVAI